ncbi:MAG: thioesterase family protein [Sutterellaceae bacterium]|nr:acyl-CoA thioesterase [Burkholderiaceae bacterium]MCX7901657.1 acyl-CoA thioesterase [Burkholderiaceae bacterium]MDW8430964.1 thioesterase family protein [Sutterellaceae bacterium]
MKEFTCEVPLRWGDMDAMAHLNNTVYFRLMEEARIQWFQKLGFSTLPTGEAPILAHVSCDFLRAMTYPGIALVRQTVTRVGHASVEMALTIERTDEPGQCYARGRAVIVWFDYRANRSAPWPEHVRRALA